MTARFVAFITFAAPIAWVTLAEPDGPAAPAVIFCSAAITGALIYRWWTPTLGSLWALPVLVNGEEPSNMVDSTNYTPLVIGLCLLVALVIAAGASARFIVQLFSSDGRGTARRWMNGEDVKLIK